MEQSVYDEGHDTLFSFIQEIMLFCRRGAYISSHLYAFFLLAIQAGPFNTSTLNPVIKRGRDERNAFPVIN